MRKIIVGVSCLGYEATGCGFIKQINDSLYDDIDSLTHGCGFCTRVKQEYYLP